MLAAAVADGGTGAAAAREGTSPAVAGVTISHQELEDLSKRMDDNATPRLSYRMMNIALQSIRDEAQCNDIARWADPPTHSVDLTGKDRIKIGLIDRSTRFENDNWVRYKTGEIQMSQPFSIHKMLADRHVRGKLLEDAEGNGFGVKSIFVQTIDPGKFYDDERTLHLINHKRYTSNLPTLPVWEWVLIREDDRRYRFRCNSNPFLFTPTEWPSDEQIGHLAPPSTGPSQHCYRRADGFRLEEFKINRSIAREGPLQPPVTGILDSSAGGEGKGGGWEPRGSGGDGQGSDNTRGSGSGCRGSGRGSQKKAEEAKVGKGPQPSQQVAGSGQVHNLGGGAAADDWGPWSGAGAVGQNASTIGEAGKGWNEYEAANSWGTLWSWDKCWSWDKGWGNISQIMGGLDTGWHNGRQWRSPDRGGTNPWNSH